MVLEPKINCAGLISIGSGPDSDDDQLAAGGEACQQRSLGFSAGRRRQNGIRAAQLAQFHPGIVGGAVDVFMRAKLAGEFFLLNPSGDGNRFEPHPSGELDREMSQTADALNGDQIAAAQPGVAKRVERGQPRTEQRGSVGRRNFIRDRGEGARFDNHDLGISAIGRHARNDQVLAVDEIASAAWLAVPTLSAKPSDTDALADLPGADFLAEGVDAAGNLVTGNSWVGDPRKDVLHGCDIAMADTRSFDSNPNLPWTRLGDRTGHQIEFPRGRHFYGLVGCCHGDLKILALGRRERSVPNSTRVGEDEIAEKIGGRLEPESDRCECYEGKV